MSLPASSSSEKASTKPASGSAAASASAAPHAAAPPKRAAGTLRDFHEEERLGAAYDTRLLRRLWAFMRPHSRYLWISLALILVIAALNLARPIVMSRLVASAADEHPSGLFAYGVALSLLVVVLQLLTFAQTYLLQIAGARSMADLRAHLFSFMQRLELRYYDRTPVGRLVTRATNDVDAINDLFASGVVNAIGDLVSLVGVVVMMVVLDAKMSLIAFAALPVVGLVVGFVRSRARGAYRDIRVKTARLNAFLNEQVAGMSVVQAYARERSMAAEFDGINLEYRDANKRSVFYEAVLDAAIEMVGTVCIASVLWWAGLSRVDDPKITFPLVVAFTQYIKQFFEPVSLLAQRYTVLQSAMSGAERVFQFLDEATVESDAAPSSTAAAPSSIAAAPSPVNAAPAVPVVSSGSATSSDLATPSSAPATSPEEAVALDHVTFGYKPGLPVLRDVSFQVRAGEKIALVGATGAGKTTVTSLLLRLYDHTEGAVRIFGKDVRAYDRRELRNLFSVVPQDVFLFAGTVASNVAMSEQDAEIDLDRVELALARIGALDVFLRRPGGLSARVDERGANFSAGERQLLAFARALYKDSPLLILDEATASIDSDTEARLQKALEVVIEGRTALLIAHRLSTIRSVDRIVVFHRGQVVEIGTHEELLAKGGVYARLYRLQFALEEQERQEHALAESV